MGRFIAAMFAGIVSAVFIFRLDGRMIPDFYAYSSGASCWSSVESCIVGKYFGPTGIQVASCIGAIACGFLTGSTIATFLLVISPVGEGITNAGADATGAAGLGFATRPKNKVAFILAVCFLHLVAGLCGISILVGKRLRIPAYISGVLAGIAAILAQYLIARSTGNRFSGIQWRYLLPGFIVAIPYLRQKFVTNSTG